MGFRPRVIPVLLLKDSGLVKSIRFADHRYIGDPINAVRLFNDLRADELVILDTDATREERVISADLVRNVGEEANMPFAVGGGIRDLEHIRELIKAGAERVVICSYATQQPEFIRQASDSFGASAIVVCMDVKRDRAGNELVWARGGLSPTGYTPEVFAKLMEEQGTGEIIVQSMERDGTMEGYDLDLIKRVTDAVDIPVMALGGAGTLDDLRQAYRHGHATGLAAGSMFVFHGRKRGVLINYPDKTEMSF